MFEITLKFLDAVAKNNSTEWLHTYRDLYQQEKKRFSDFFWKVLEEAKVLNPILEDLELRDCIYRFNKDIRFSKDKKPYKENFGGILAYGGKKSWYPCFYFHLQPGNKSFIAWGVYFPSQINENKVRAHLLKHYEIREKFLKDKDINSYYILDDARHQYKTTARLKAIIEKNPVLKTQISPLLKEYWITDTYWKSIEKIDSIQKGWEILQQLAFNKDRWFSHSLSDKDVSSPCLYDEMIRAYKLILPVLNFFQDAYDWPEYNS